ncbi:MAG TPA: YncE family protein [Burkholderiaceae bacterium]|nr:YncE family protein [Burkholderiaceae bacterium]
MKLPFALLAAAALAAAAQPVAIQTVPGMPPVPDPANLYSETGAGKLSPTVANHLPRVYVPNRQGNDVWVIDPATLQVVDKFRVGIHPQHVVPSWDLKTLWVANNAEGRTDGSLTPIDPATGKPGKPIAVDDPYNLYFTPDGKYAIVVAEARKRLDFRDPHTMAMKFSLDVPQCAGVNHADFSIDGRYAIFTCEFAGTLAKIDLVERRVLGYLKLKMPERRFKETKLAPGQVWEPGETELCTVTKGMPQDIRIAPDGRRFYVADMHADGVHVIDGEHFVQVGFIATGVGAHGLYPSRDGKLLYVVNRGSHKVFGPKSGSGSIAVIDFATEKVVTRWGIPGGGSPDMGNLTADGKQLWLGGRFDDLVYIVDTTSGAVRTVRAGKEPHGLTVWPQPGRYSLGHTGNLR